MKPLLVSSGEPAGIGPDLCLSLAALDIPLVVFCDKSLLKLRAQALNLSINFHDYIPDAPLITKPGHLTVLSIPCPVPVSAGKLDVQNAPYVLELLEMAAKRTIGGEFSALVTAPVQKSIINQAGMTFTGHTEFFADFYKVDTVVMLLACEHFKVALMTTHLPLKMVSEAITPTRIVDVIRQLNQALIQDFGIKQPEIMVAGLNPHAGESGYLGREEIDCIEPALKQLRSQGIIVKGPLPADTLFSKANINHCDVFVAMYHDQGLPVLKYAGFGEAVNVTLGLPIIRTSVDHGTALELAGTGKASSGSLIAAVEMAALMVKQRGKN